jgi:hypothetical protein
MSACPVCGHPDGACTAKPQTHQIITSTGVITTRRQRVPIVRSRVGKAGYVGEGTGELELYDPTLPHITFVDEPIEIPAEPADAGDALDLPADAGAAGPVTKRRRRKAR